MKAAKITNVERDFTTNFRLNHAFENALVWSEPDKKKVLMDPLEENRAYDDISNRTRPSATCYPFLIIILLYYINVVVTTLKMEERYIFNEAYLPTIKSPYHSTLGLSIHYDNIDSIWASFIYANYTISTWLDPGPSANIYYPT